MIFPLYTCPSASTTTLILMAAILQMQTCRIIHLMNVISLAANSVCQKTGKNFHVECVFKDCKMLGLQFGDCNAIRLGFSFETCIMNHCSFYKIKARKNVFKNWQLQEADFTYCDAGNSAFNHSDLVVTIFENSNIEWADFSTTYNYSINPSINCI